MTDTLVSREITTHLHVPQPSPFVKIGIECVGPPALGGARNHYNLTLRRVQPESDLKLYGAMSLPILFQNGNPAVAGGNGFTMEALLAIVADRLEGLQAGDYPCKENENALACIKEGLEHLHHRSRRMDQMYIDRDL